MLDTRAPIFLPCAQGVEPLLAAECRTLLPEGTPIEESRGGVRVTAGPLEAMNLNLHSRLAQRVLWPLRGARYRDEHDLYAAAREVDWPPWIPPPQTLRVATSAFR
ncbi:MAG: THUMP domain-containing protein, partial [Burkholderiaceae bacterium]